MLALVLWPLAALAAENVPRAIEQKFAKPPRFGFPVQTPAMRHPPPRPPVPLEDILASPVVQKALRPGALVQVIASGDTTAIEHDAIVNVHALADEHEFFYLVDPDGRHTRRVEAEFVVDIAADIAMYEPPREYTPITSLRNISPHDRPYLRVVEVSLAAGQTNAGWTADLLEADQARSTMFTRPGVSLMGDWPEHLRLGATFQYEASSHRTSQGSANYQNPTIGVLAKTKRYDFWSSRLGLQLRWGPAAKLQVPGPGVSSSVELRTSTLQLSWERTEQNSLGEWAWGLLWQREWVKIRSQTQYTRLAPRGRTNDQLGLFISQGLPW